MVTQAASVPPVLKTKVTPVTQPKALSISATSAPTEPSTAIVPIVRATYLVGDNNSSITDPSLSYNDASTATASTSVSSAESESTRVTVSVKSSTAVNSNKSTISTVDNQGRSRAPSELGTHTNARGDNITGDKGLATGSFGLGFDTTGARRHLPVTGVAGACGATDTQPTSASAMRSGIKRGDLAGVDGEALHTYAATMLTGGRSLVACGGGSAMASARSGAKSDTAKRSYPTKTSTTPTSLATVAATTVPATTAGLSSGAATAFGLAAAALSLTPTVALESQLVRLVSAKTEPGAPGTALTLVPPTKPRAASVPLRASPLTEASGASPAGADASLNTSASTDSEGAKAKATALMPQLFAISSDSRSSSNIRERQLQQQHLQQSQQRQGQDLLLASSISDYGTGHSDTRTAPSYIHPYPQLRTTADGDLNDLSVFFDAFDTLGADTMAPDAAENAGKTYISGGDTAAGLRIARAATTTPALEADTTVDVAEDVIDAGTSAAAENIVDKDSASSGAVVTVTSEPVVATPDHESGGGVRGKFKLNGAAAAAKRAEYDDRNLEQILYPTREDDHDENSVHSSFLLRNREESNEKANTHDVSFSRREIGNTLRGSLRSAIASSKDKSTFIASSSALGGAGQDGKGSEDNSLRAQQQAAKQKLDLDHVPQVSSPVPHARLKLHASPYSGITTNTSHTLNMTHAPPMGTVTPLHITSAPATTGPSLVPALPHGGVVHLLSASSRAATPATSPRMGTRTGTHTTTTTSTSINFSSNGVVGSHGLSLCPSLSHASQGRARSHSHGGSGGGSSSRRKRLQATVLTDKATTAALAAAAEAATAAGAGVGSFVPVPLLPGLSRVNSIASGTSGTSGTSGSSRASNSDEGDIDDDSGNPRTGPMDSTLSSNVPSTTLETSGKNLIGGRLGFAAGLGVWGAKASGSGSGGLTSSSLSASGGVDGVSGGVLWTHGGRGTVFGDEQSKSETDSTCVYSNTSNLSNGASVTSESLSPSRSRSRQRHFKSYDNTSTPSSDVEKEEYSAEAYYNKHGTGDEQFHLHAGAASPTKDIAQLAAVAAASVAAAMAAASDKTTKSQRASARTTDIGTPSILDSSKSATESSNVDVVRECRQFVKGLRAAKGRSYKHSRKLYQTYAPHGIVRALSDSKPDSAEGVNKSTGVDVGSRLNKSSNNKDDEEFDMDDFLGNVSDNVSDMAFRDEDDDRDHISATGSGAIGGMSHSGSVSVLCAGLRRPSRNASRIQSPYLSRTQSHAHSHSRSHSRAHSRSRSQSPGRTHSDSGSLSQRDKSKAVENIGQTAITKSSSLAVSQEIPGIVRAVSAKQLGSQESSSTNRGIDPSIGGLADSNIGSVIATPAAPSSNVTNYPSNTATTDTAKTAEVTTGHEILAVDSEAYRGPGTNALKSTENDTESVLGSGSGSGTGSGECGSRGVGIGVLILPPALQDEFAAATASSSSLSTTYDEEDGDYVCKRTESSSSSSSSSGSADSSDSARGRGVGNGGGKSRLDTKSYAQLKSSSKSSCNVGSSASNVNINTSAGPSASSDSRDSHRTLSTSTVRRLFKLGDGKQDQLYSMGASDTAANKAQHKTLRFAASSTNVAEAGKFSASSAERLSHHLESPVVTLSRGRQRSVSVTTDDADGDDEESTHLDISKTHAKSENVKNKAEISSISATNNSSRSRNSSVDAKLSFVDDNEHVNSSSKSSHRHVRSQRSSNSNSRSRSRSRSRVRSKQSSAGGGERNYMREQERNPNLLVLDNHARKLAAAAFASSARESSTTTATTGTGSSGQEAQSQRPPMTAEQQQLQQRYWQRQQQQQLKQRHHKCAWGYRTRSPPPLRSLCVSPVATATTPPTVIMPRILKLDTSSCADATSSLSTNSSGVNVARELPVKAGSLTGICPNCDGSSSADTAGVSATNGRSVSRTLYSLKEYEEESTDGDDARKSSASARKSSTSAIPSSIAGTSTTTTDSRTNLAQQQQTTQQQQLQGQQLPTTQQRKRRRSATSPFALPLATPTAVSGHEWRAAGTVAAPRQTVIGQQDSAATSSKALLTLQPSDMVNQNGAIAASHSRDISVSRDREKTKRRSRTRGYGKTGEQYDGQH